ncbi:cupin domain-containing protein [Halobaculum sp. P14]|uniref:cupin domain-containing protein n=1 Tax=Halobaculum sp. P14 TaxID=3421638 RepID=UPI003EBA7693
METVDIDAVAPTPTETGVQRRTLTDPLAAANLAVNHYLLAPDDRLSSGLHAHTDQEEVFVVVEGSVAFETPDGTVTVGGGEAVRFAPGEYQSGRNAADRDAVVLAVGAPRDGGEIRVPRVCPDCGHDGMRPEADADGDAYLTCPDCGVEELSPPPRGQW